MTFIKGRAEPCDLWVCDEHAVRALGAAPVHGAQVVRLHGVHLERVLPLHHRLQLLQRGE